MANFRPATALRNAQANAVTTLVDAGVGAGTLKCYSGTQPATGDAAITGTLLATFTLTDPAVAAAAAGVATIDFDPDLSTTAAATGTPTHFRIADSAGAAVVDGDIAVTGASLNFDSVTWVSGGTVNLTTGTVTAPAG